MRPLSKKYAARKAELGQKPIRNMMLHGSHDGRRSYQRFGDDGLYPAGGAHQSPEEPEPKGIGWFGLSDNDEAKTLLFAEQFLEKKL